MHFIENEIYHVYNRGNQKQTIFRNRDNYLYFLEKIRFYIAPRCELLAWCLMPNHFHFVLSTTINSTTLVPKSNLPVQNLTEGIRLMLSGYTKGFNKAHGFSGNLFQQKTKAKLLTGGNSNYPFIAFHYVHQNPMAAGLVKRMEDWEFSSFNEYYGHPANPLCNKELGIQLIGFDPRKFYEESYKVNVKLLESSIL